MSEGYSSKEAKYEFYNFHNRKKLSEIKNKLLSQRSDFRILLLNGEIGVGRDYCLQSVIYSLQQLNPEYNYDYAPLDWWTKPILGNTYSMKYLQSEQPSFPVVKQSLILFLKTAQSGQFLSDLRPFQNSQQF